MKRMISIMTAAVLVLASVQPVASGEDEEPIIAKYKLEVERAVGKGLAYLAGVQAEEGFFNGGHGKVTGVVSLCGMAFLAKGHVPGQGPYGKALDRCIDYVLKCQRQDGMLAENSGSYGGGGMYSHSISTLFLCEVSGMVTPERQEKIDKALSKAIEVILAAQAVQKDQNNKGGWRYQPNSGDSDMSCTGWALMALRSARLNGAQVPQEAIDFAVKYVLQHQDNGQGCIGYQGTQDFAITLTGAGLLCLELTGHHGEESTLKAAKYILRTFKELPNQERPFYGTYYSSQAMFQIGGQYWDKYASWMYEYWLPKQKGDGSWEGWGGKWGGNNEQAYHTAMMVLSFTVPYRQLPIYQRDESVDEED